MKNIFLKNILIGIPVISFSLLVACSNQTQNTPVDRTTEITNSTDTNLDQLQVAYFASGCFWCVEAVFQSVIGVEEVTSGYAGGSATTATYPQVSSGRTKHAESVQVYYDSTKISYNTLLTVFFDSHDPSTLNQQGPDKGPQYRSEIFYNYPYQKKQANHYIDSLLENKIHDRVTTLVTAFDAFYPAEDYHQEYERNHPNNPYVKSVSIPRLNKFKAKHPELLKKEEH